MHDDTYFAQLLEGSRRDVNALYRRIVQDPRHDEVTPLLYASATRRVCAGWSMHFVNGDRSLMQALGTRAIPPCAPGCEPEQLAWRLIECLTMHTKPPCRTDDGLSGVH